MTLQNQDCIERYPVVKAYKRSELALRAARKGIKVVNDHIERGIPKDKFSWTIFI